MRRILILAVAALAACDSKPAPTATPSPSPGPAPGPAPAATRNDPAAPADPDTVITGRVLYTGKAVKAVKVKIAEPECAAIYTEENPLLEEKLVVNPNGTIRNALVWISKGLEGRAFPPPSQSFRLSQKGCRYEPHVFGIVAGQDVVIVNEDSFKHNVHLMPKRNQFSPDNWTQLPGAEDTRRVTIVEEPFLIKCDVHPFMGSWCLAAPSPHFAVTGEDGAFELRNLPPGEFVVACWTEKLGTQTKTVKIEAKQKAPVEFSFENK